MGTNKVFNSISRLNDGIVQPICLGILSMIKKTTQGIPE
jgi:hypothetical protein